MPNFFNFNFMERFPVPSLRNYVAFSVVLLTVVLYYARDTVMYDDEWRDDFTKRMDENGLSETTKTWLEDSVLARIIYFLLTDQFCIWAVVNTACCALVLIGKLLQCVVFGKLRASEQQQMRDRFWNYVFYKFVFVFGVLNVQYFDEVVLWSVWFTVVGFFYLLTTLAHDRFKYIASSPATTPTTNIRIMALLAVILFFTMGLFLVAAVVSAKFGFNYGGFLAAECMMLFFRALYGFIRYAVHVYDLKQEITWENRTSFLYYTELVFELLLLMTDFIHHIHMLIWSNIFLSMASLVICMQLKHLYQEIDKRLRRHRNYQRIVIYMDNNYPMASKDELTVHDDNCAICWDKMENARKLPCGHLFHDSCLRGWLEQDTSCPTCRTVLPLGNQNNQEPQRPPDDPPVPRRRHRNYFLHFDGRRYARWLPSFSVEVTHSLGGLASTRSAPQLTSQYARMAEQVREMFPDMPMNVIMEDLQETNSVEATVENILENRLQAPHDAVADIDVSSASSSEGVESEDYESDGSSSSNSSFSRVISHDHMDAEPSTSNVVPQAPSRPSMDVSNEPPSCSYSQQASNAGRFSKSAGEREVILEDRKRQLIDSNRRKYLSSTRGQDLIGLMDEQTSGEPNSDVRRRMVLSAIERRMRSQASSNGT